MGHRLNLVGETTGIALEGAVKRRCPLQHNPQRKKSPFGLPGNGGDCGAYAIQGIGLRFNSIERNIHNSPARAIDDQAADTIDLRIRRLDENGPFWAALANVSRLKVAGVDDPWILGEDLVRMPSAQY
jgi:hypothetical protein